MRILKAFILFILLSIISLLVVFINGDEYTAKINIYDESIKSIDDIIIKINNENIVELIDKKYEENLLSLRFKSLKKGKTFVDVNSKNNSYGYIALYVHNFGLITYNEFLGDCNYIKIVPICMIIFLSYVFYLLICKYKENLKESMYQYKNILYLGLIIFLFFSLLDTIFGTLDYSGISNAIRHVISFSTMFSIIALPVAFIVFLFITISNIVLIKKEGFTWKNLLGLILGIFLCFMSIMPEIIYNLLYSAPWIDIHKETGIARYVLDFVDVTIYTIVSYLEAILVGSIIMGIKSAKHIPKIDKDYIIILGCQIKKDGTLTNLLKSRVDRAIEFSKMQKESSGKDIIFVPSGGKGSDEVISEAEAIKNYLLTQGIENEKILVENNSKNTDENIEFSKKLIYKANPNAKVAFSTTNYHVFRAGIIANSKGLAAEGIGAKTKSYFWLNAFIREYIATLYSERKKHLFIFIAIILFVLIMFVILYFTSNI